MITVIVPIYNALKYLDACVCSILKQTYSDIEVILVNDGSEDDSGLRCEYYANLDNRVVVIHQNNRGVSAARNAALDIARGDYVIFMDPDDFWIDDDVLTNMYKRALLTNADIVRGEYIRVDDQGVVLSKSTIKKSYCKQKIASNLFLEEIIKNDCFIWLLLIKASLLKDIRFTPQRQYMEDAELLFRILLKTKVAAYIPLYIYAYRQNICSVSNRKTGEKVKDMLNISSVCFELSCLANLELSESLIKRSVNLYIGAIRMSVIYRLDVDEPNFINSYCFDDYRKRINNKRYVKSYLRLLLYVPSKQFYISYKMMYYSISAVKSVFRRIIK